jgi:hypothetical protein
VSPKQGTNSDFYATSTHFYEDIARSFVWLQFGLFSPADYHRGSRGYCFTKPKERLTLELVGC